MGWKWTSLKARRAADSLFTTPGSRRKRKKLATRTLDAMEGSDYVVVPSGSCGAMMRVFYEDLFADDPEMLERAERSRRARLRIHGIPDRRGGSGGDTG